MGRIPNRAKRKLRPFSRSVRTKTSRNSPLFRHNSEEKAAPLTTNSHEFPSVVFQRQNKGISCCRLPRGRRGLKYAGRQALRPAPRRLPRGRRGLKCGSERHARKPSGSPPAREAWIEIKSSSNRYTGFPSPPAREAWIEIHAGPTAAGRAGSPPAREAWIEMPRVGHDCAQVLVASREGGVD